jgi:uncharacterized repeat protein (TIGR01451 family)
MLAVCSFSEDETELVLDDELLLGDEILLEDLGETLNSEDLILEQLPASELPTNAIPQVTPAPTPELSSEETVSDTAEEAPAEQPNTNTNNIIVNVVDVTESFYKLVFNDETNIYTRSETSEAKPGDLIELVITATNQSDETVSDVEMTNTVPTGPILLLTESFETNLTQSLFRVSRNGKDFFPSDAQLEAGSIRYIQWVILTLAPGESLDFKYRIQIDK